MLITLEFAFPDRHHVPSKCPESGNVFAIPLPNSGELGPPILWASFRHLRVSAAIVLMPEAPMHEYRLPSRFDRDVG